MLRKYHFFQPGVKFCQKLCTMSAADEKTITTAFETIASAGNMTERGKKRLRRYKHQQKLDKKHVPHDDSKQLPNYCEENFNETDYYHQNGLRKVYPYYYSFSTYVKGRWMGRTILDVFTKEFHSHSPEYYKSNIEMGRVTVNKEKVTPDFILGHNHLIEHTCHRHENPIKHTELEILVDTDDVLVVNKPSSWPMHPCGRYRYNSVTTILKKQYGYENLRGLYRLDRLTSGVLIMAKTGDFAAKVMKDIANRNVQKEYVARVVGYFPDGVIECKEPLLCISYRVSIYRTDPKGKESSTTFERMSYNGKASVVKCMPHTGRTHQIRVHLQYLGHPIINDNLYNSEAFGPSRAKGGLPGDIDTVQLENEILKHHNVGMFCESYENPVFLRKQANAAEKNLKHGTELKDDSTLDNEAVAASNDADIDTVKSEIVEDYVVAVTDVSNEKMENVTSHEINNVGVCDSVKRTEKHIVHSGEEPAQKRMKVDSNEIKDKAKIDNEKSNDVKIEPSAENLEAGKQVCVNDQESAFLNDEGLDERTSEPNKVAADIDQTAHNMKRTSSASNVGTDSVEKRSQTQKPSGSTCIIEEYNEEKMYEFTDLCCQDCKTAYIDPQEEDLVMYLHAYRYKGSDWEYGTPLPDWAHEDWQE